MQATEHKSRDRAKLTCLLFFGYVDGGIEWGRSVMVAVAMIQALGQYPLLAAACIRDVSSARSK